MDLELEDRGTGKVNFEVALGFVARCEVELKVLGWNLNVALGFVVAWEAKFKVLVGI